MLEILQAIGIGAAAVATLVGAWAGYRKLKPARELRILLPQDDAVAKEYIEVHGDGAPKGSRVLLVNWLVHGSCWLQPYEADPDPHGHWVHPRCHLSVSGDYGERYVYALAVKASKVTQLRALFETLVLDAADLQRGLKRARIRFELSRGKRLFRAAGGPRRLPKTIKKCQSRLATNEMSGPVVLLDLSCFRFLRSAESRAALSRQLSFIDATTLGTAINMIEILRHGSATARTWLRDVLTFLAGGRALLPWPYGLLERIGKEITSGATQFQLAPSGFEHLLTKDPTPTVLARADDLVEEMEEQFRTMQDEARPQVQEFVRDRGLIGEWDGAREFLDEMWMRPSHIDDYVLGIWEKNGLPLPCPVDEVRQNPSWRVFFEAYGVAAYEQAILPNRARTFGMLDLMQLVYPTGFAKGSIFVTNDNSLARVGEIVVSEVVPGARVMEWNDFIDR